MHSHLVPSRLDFRFLSSLETLGLGAVGVWGDSVAPGAVSSPGSSMLGCCLMVGAWTGRAFPVPGD